MDSSGRDIAQMRIEEEATNQVGELLQPVQGSSGLAFEVPFGLVDASTANSVRFDVLPSRPQSGGVELGRVGRESRCVGAQPSRRSR